MPVCGESGSCPAKSAAGVAPPPLVPMTIGLAGRTRLSAPAGTFAARRIEVERAAGADSVFFEVDFPPRLIGLDTAEGSHYRPRESIRLDSWNHHGNGDERLSR